MKRRKRRPKVRRICSVCGKKFLVWQSRIDMGKGKFCSISCGKMGKNNTSWNGGKKKIDGYVYILKKDHPFAIGKGYVKEQRLIMEKHIRRYLKPTEVVHHKNNIRNDNRIKNLELLQNQAEHLKIHMKGNKIWLGKKHKRETIEKMKKSWTVRRKKEQSEKFRGTNNPNYRHGRYIYA